MDKEQLEKLMALLKPNAEETLPIVFGENLEKQVQNNRGQRINSLDYPGRFEIMGLIATGGMGEIHHVYDHAMRRNVALKTLKDEWKDDAGVMDAFLTEAHLTAQLHHPGIIPVHEYGFLHDGRCYYTMPIIQGKTLSDLVQEVHLEPIAARKRHISKLIDYLLKAAETIAYAHAQQILHQDIKPSNIMIGEHGEVYVADWGLARELLDYDSDLSINISGGTPAYMPPERFQTQKILSLDADVYALGATLYKILCGQAPFQKVSVNDEKKIELERHFMPLQHYLEEGFPIPNALIVICETAMHHEPKSRYQNADRFCQVLRDWLHGELRKKEAQEMLKTAESHIEKAQTLHQESLSIARLGHQKLLGIPLWASEHEKKEGWNLLDRAKRLRADCDLAWIAHKNSLYAAISHAPDLYEAHARLAEYYIAKIQYAEAHLQPLTAERALAQLDAHVQALPAHYPNKIPWLSFINGQSILNLKCSQNFSYRLHRFKSQNRKLTPVLQAIGQFPIVDLLLEMGSYVLTIESPEIVPTTYPFQMLRRQAWRTSPPDEKSGLDVKLVRADAVDEDDIFIPAGWTKVGSPNNDLSTLPYTSVWLEDYIIKRTPVTNREFIAFLNALVANNEIDKAEQYAPRERSGTIGITGALIYGQNDDGSFFLRPDSDGDVWQEDWPVVMVDWNTAQAYANWLSEKTGLPWRLPHEIEWEKAARGVDSRLYPWGDHHDPSWCNMLESSSYNPLLASVHSFANDCSVYGMLGAAGNVSDWCQNGYSMSTFPIQNQRISQGWFNNSQKIIRGGSWAKRDRDGLCCTREYRGQDDRISNVGIRIARSLVASDYL